MYRPISHLLQVANGGNWATTQPKQPVKASKRLKVERKWLLAIVVSLIVLVGIALAIWSDSYDMAHFGSLIRY